MMDSAMKTKEARINDCVGGDQKTVETCYTTIPY